MKFAIVEGERREAQPGLSAKCRVCDDAMIAKCGHIRVPHWAHRATTTCDRWWESETEWHRAWKDHFPKAWQEFIHQSEDGEKHIADVKTESGIVLEFQHSHLSRDEREARENFYPKMVWVVDGRRLKRDRARFFASLDSGIVITREPRIVSVLSKENELLRDWGSSRVPVYFDFGDSDRGIRHASIHLLFGDLARVARTARRIYQQCRKSRSCTLTLKVCLSKRRARRPLSALRPTVCCSKPLGPDRL